MPRIAPARRTTALLSGAALAALASAGPAAAFDDVDWSWQSDVVSSVDTDVTVTVDVEADGLAQVESEQSFVGAVTSASTVLLVTSAPPLGAALTADDLARVESAATSVGNNASIESDVMLQVDSVQSVTGYDPLAPVSPTTGLALPVPALISAVSLTAGTTNVAVDSAATGVANSLAIEGEAGDVLIANNVQDSFALITVISSVEDVTATGFSGLGAMDAPLAGSVATAVGNNLSINAGGVPEAPMP